MSTCLLTCTGCGQDVTVGGAPNWWGIAMATKVFEDIHMMCGHPSTTVDKYLRELDVIE